MSRTHHHADQLSLLPTRPLWRELPLETRRRVVRWLAHLLVEKVSSPKPSSLPSTQEQPHASRRH
jgi:hypothetical protein